MNIFRKIERNDINLHDSNLMDFISLYSMLEQGEKGGKVCRNFKIEKLKKRFIE